MKPIRLPSKPRHIRLYDEDCEFIERMYGRGSPQPIGMTKAIRGIVHIYVQKLKDRAKGLSQSEMAALAPQLPGGQDDE